MVLTVWARISADGKTGAGWTGGVDPEAVPGATKESNGRVLDELVAVSSLHRKDATRLLRKPSKVRSGDPVIGRCL